MALLANYAQQLAAQGHAGDNTVAHLTPGEIVLPAQASPQVRNAVLQAMKAGGIDPMRFTVGSQDEHINSQTGLPEFDGGDGGDGGGGDGGGGDTGGGDTGGDTGGDGSGGGDTGNGGDTGDGGSDAGGNAGVGGSGDVGLDGGGEGQSGDVGMDAGSEAGSASSDVAGDNGGILGTGISSHDVGRGLGGLVGGIAGGPIGALGGGLVGGVLGGALDGGNVTGSTTDSSPDSGGIGVNGASGTSGIGGTGASTNVSSTGPIGGSAGVGNTSQGITANASNTSSAPASPPVVPSPPPPPPPPPPAFDASMLKALNLAPDYGNDAIQGVINQQQAVVEQQLQNARARGQLSDTGYNAAEQELANQTAKGQSTLNTARSGLLAKYGQQLADTRNQDIASLTAPGAFADQAGLNTATTNDASTLQTLYNTLTGNFKGDLLNASPTSLYDVPTLMTYGGTVQGVQNNRSPITDQLYSLYNDNNHGVGSQGVF